MAIFQCMQRYRNIILKVLKNVRIERPQSRSPFFSKVDFELVQSQVIFFVFFVSVYLCGGKNVVLTGPHRCCFDAVCNVANGFNNHGTKLSGFVLFNLFCSQG